MYFCYKHHVPADLTKKETATLISRLFQREEILFGQYKSNRTFRPRVLQRHQSFFQQSNAIILDTKNKFKKQLIFLLEEQVTRDD